MLLALASIYTSFIILQGVESVLPMMGSKDARVARLDVSSENFPLLTLNAP